VLTYELSLTPVRVTRTTSTGQARDAGVGAADRRRLQTVVGLEHSIDRWFEPYRSAGYSVVVTGVSVPVARMSILNDIDDDRILLSLVVAHSFSAGISRAIAFWRDGAGDFLPAQWD
jgi:hypothetical protein